MDSANPNSGSTNASSRAESLRAWLLRPVAARLAEPLLWCAGLAPYFAVDDERSRALAHVGAVFLVARLCVDTAPNLVVCRRIEAAPYGDHFIRRSLARVKLRLAILAVLVIALLDRVVALRWLTDRIVLPVVAHPDGDPAAAAWTFADFMMRGEVLLAIALLSYTVAAPVLLEHRGVPVARPSFGPISGAFLFACAVLIGRPSQEHVVLVAAGCIVAGNLFGSGFQRYRAASRRITRPGFEWMPSTVDAITHDTALEAARILERSATVVPFALLPVFPAIADLAAGVGAHPLAILAAATGAALPPILFDAKLAARRFRFAAYGIAACLVIPCVIGRDLKVTRPLLDTAALVLAYPALNRLISRGAMRSIVAALVVFALTKVFVLVRYPELPWPIAESAFAILAYAAALED